MSWPNPLNTHLADITDRRTAPRSATLTRRRTPRIRGPWDGRVRGRDASGAKFTESVVLEDVSAGGLYVRLERSLQPGSVVMVVFAFSMDPSANPLVPKVAARGEVRRSEELAGGALHGVGIHFRQHRFL